MKRTLLIVDDVRMNRELLKKIFAGEYELWEAANGQEALDLLTGRPGEVSALLLDLVMPVMDGYETLRRIRADERLRQLPVIVTTGSVDTEAEVRALALGANDYVTKPYAAEILRHRISNTILLRETAAQMNAAERDDVTGLYNRRAFFSRAAALFSGREPGAYVVACYDIDSFKVVNDQYGTDRGDAVLRHAAEALRAGFEPVGGLCCRIMADIFAVVYPRAALDEERLTEIHRAAAAPEGLAAPLTISVGRCVAEDLRLPVSALYDRAAMAAATVKGRYDCHVALYDESMRQRLLHEQRVVTEMRPALRDGRFEVWFQPQYNHFSGALVGAEALVRWRVPDGRLIPPGDFIPVFERNGFVYELDKFVWERVCALLRKWLDAGRAPLPVSVNVSRRDVFREDFFAVLTGLLEKYALPPSLLRLEITETSFAPGEDHLVGMVRQLRDHGFTVEIDDFGSGYSSLNTLKDVPADILKLDMKFLEDTGDSRRGGNILESVVRMTKWLGMSVIAEGVETKAQADFLRSVGCYYVQGYLYGRPMPTEDYETLAATAEKESRLASLETVEDLDNGAFWDPASMDSLVFNSYVGGACVFEYTNGAVELLRVNRSYIRELGIRCGAEAPFASLDPFIYMDAAGKAAVRACAERALADGGEHSCETRLSDDGTFFDGPQYIRSTFRLIARTGERRLFYCLIRNITRETERDEQLRFLSDMAGSLLAGEDADGGVDGSLRRLLEYLDGNRAYIFEFDYSRQVARNSYEVCAAGISAEKDTLQAVSLALMRFWFAAFKRDGYYAIEDVAALDESRAEERAQLLAQDIKALFVVPLRRNGHIFGMLGVDDPRQRFRQLDRLLALADYLAVMLTRRDLSAKILRDNETLTALINDMPGGFVRMRLLPEGGVAPVFCNRGFLSLVGMDQAGFDALYAGDSFAGVHPQDRASVHESVRKLLQNGQGHSRRYRLRRGDGGYVWVRFFGRTVQDEAGETYLNIFYTDETELLRQEAEESSQTVKAGRKV